MVDATRGELRNMLVHNDTYNQAFYGNATGGRPNDYFMRPLRDARHTEAMLPGEMPPQMPQMMLANSIHPSAPGRVSEPYPGAFGAQFMGLGMGAPMPGSFTPLTPQSRAGSPQMSIHSMPSSPEMNMMMNMNNMNDGKIQQLSLPPMP